MITETTITEDGDGGGPEKQGFHLLVMSPEVFASQPLPASGVVTVGRSSRCMVQIDDGMASREHARIHLGSEGGVAVLTIEDIGSANGTRVRDSIIRPGEPAAILPGEAIIIGSTVIMVLQDRPPPGLRRLWSHAYFETRIDDECARAAKARATFALARLRLSGAAAWMKVMPVLAQHLMAPHMFALYGPKDYEILFLDTEAGEVEALVQKLLQSFRTAGLEAQCAVAWYPKDGRTGDALLGTANTLLKAPAAQPTGGELPLPSANGMHRVRALATRAATASINVLILGEMGVGKDVLARMIHQMSPRAGKPFLALNCAGIPETLIESELFGHEKGAFSGATATKVGLFEAANGGTVFLDEIGEMPVAMQAKLLQVIETREVRPIGGRLQPRPIDVRFISATNVDIEAAVSKGAFRGDLMYRLNTLSLAIPPLRERKDEIEPLVATFLSHMSRELGRTEEVTVSAEAMECLVRYSWPGNIRELKNVVERAVVLCDGPAIQPEHLPLEKMRPGPGNYVTVEGAGAPAVGGASFKNLPTLDDPKALAERQKILDALEACAFNQTRAAARLNISRRTLVSRLDQFGIPRPQKGQDEDEVESTNVRPTNGGPTMNKLTVAPDEVPRE